MYACRIDVTELGQYSEGKAALFKVWRRGRGGVGAEDRGRRGVHGWLAGWLAGGPAGWLAGGLPAMMM